MKKISIVLILILLSCSLNAQNKIIGKVTDTNHAPLLGTTVFLPELNKGTITDKDGHYELVNIPNGKNKIQFSFLGYANKIETVMLNDSSLELNVSLKESAIETEEVVVSGGYNSTQHENAVKIDVLKINSLNLKSTPNFTEVLTKVPGVDMISKGSGISKPVIRGLSMNNILVLNNGVRYENYQYSSHHPLGIDEFGIDDIEIIKGPASLLYGSDAIGGVVNFIKEKPAPINSIVGDYNLQLFSNSLGITNNLGVKGSSKKCFASIRIGQKSDADFLQGGGKFVPNSRFNENSIKANTGFTSKIGVFKLFYDYNNEKLGLSEDEAIDEIANRGRKAEIWYQEFGTHMLSSQNKLYLGNYRIDVNAAYQNTMLTHYTEPNVTQLQMRLATLTYETKLYLPTDTKSDYIIGFQGMNQNNVNLNNRETILLPNAVTNNFSVFGLFQHTFFSKLKLQTGIRYDNKSINTKVVSMPDSTDYRAALNKDYRSFSGSFGMTYNLSKYFFLRANIAAAYRTPNLAELTSNGPHEVRYEIGDNNLVPENSYETDLSMHYHKENFTFDLAGFYNKIDHYIYIAPTGQTTSDGLFVYKYRQANSYLFGGEAGIHIHPESVKWLHFETTFSSVTGLQNNGDYLPFIPANKLNIELKVEKHKMLFMENAFTSINSETAFDQNNPALDETATSGYTLFDFKLGGKIKLNNQHMEVCIGINNIFDTKYIDHLSTLKEVNMFNPGRNIFVSLKIPFGIKNIK